MNRRDAVELFDETLEPGDPFRITFDHRVHLFDRADKNIGQEDETDELAIGKLALDRVVGAEEEREQVDEPNQKVIVGRTDAHHFIKQEFRTAISLVPALEALGFIGLVRECLDHADAAHGCFDAGTEFTQILEDARVHLRHALVEEHQSDRDERNHDESGDSQLDVDVQHQQERSQQSDDRDKDVLRAVVGHFGNFEKIRSEASHQFAGLLVVVIAERLFLKMAVELAAHIRLDVDAQFVAEEHNDVLHRRIDDVKEQQTDRHQQDQIPVTRRQNRIDDAVDDDRKGKLQYGRQDGAAKINQEQPLVWLIIAEKTV